MNETVVTIDHNRGPQQPQHPAAPRPAGPPPPTATTTQPPGGALGWIQFNYQYFLFTIPGYLKIAQLVSFEQKIMCSPVKMYSNVAWGGGCKWLNIALISRGAPFIYIYIRPDLSQSHRGDTIRPIREGARIITPRSVFCVYVFVSILKRPRQKKPVVIALQEFEIIAHTLNNAMISIVIIIIYIWQTNVIAIWAETKGVFLYIFGFSGYLSFIEKAEFSSFVNIKFIYYLLSI